MIPTWLIKPLMLLAVIAALLGGVAAAVAYERRIGSDAATAKLTKENADALADAIKVAQADSAKKQSAAEKSHAADVQRAAAAAAAASSARSELDRLRNAIKAPSPAASGGAATTGPLADDTAVYRGLLDACSVEYESVAGEAGELARQVVGLQGFVLALGIGGGSPPVGVGLRVGLTDLATQPTTAPPVRTQVPVVPPQGKEVANADL